MSPTRKSYMIIAYNRILCNRFSPELRNFFQIAKKNSAAGVPPQRTLSGKIAGKIADRALVDVQQELNALQRDIFVGAVHDGLVVLHLGTERDAVFERPCVRSAADGDGGGVFARARREGA